MHKCFFFSRWWVLAILLCVVSSHLFAKVYTVETVPNVRLTNRLNHVSNPDGILTPMAVAQINGMLTMVEDSLGIEVAVVALSDIGEVPPRTFANELFNHWHIGKAGADNGLLLQLVTTPGKRTIVFETGYGIEGVLPDALCKRIQQRHMIPLLRKDDFSGGMVAGVEAVCQHFLEQTTEQPQQQVVAPLVLTGTARQVLIGLGLVGMALSAFAVYWVVYGSLPRCPRCGRRGFKERDYTSKYATTSCEGEGVIERKCRHCGYSEKKTYTIPYVTVSPYIPYLDDEEDSGFGGRGSFRGGRHSSGDSDSSDSDSWGSSWGGGSSGGGGACSSF